MATAKKNDSEKAETTEQVTAAAHDALDRLASQVAEAEQRIRAAAEDAGASIEDRTRKLRDGAEEKKEQMDELIRDNPYAATGLAFAAGVLASMLLRRR